MSMTLGDLVIGITFFYSVVDLTLQWGHYRFCSKPIVSWLLTSYLLILLYKICFLFIAPWTPQRSLRQAHDMPWADSAVHVADPATVYPYPEPASAASNAAPHDAIQPERLAGSPRPPAARLDARTAGTENGTQASELRVDMEGANTLASDHAESHPADAHRGDLVTPGSPVFTDRNFEGDRNPLLFTFNALHDHTLEDFSPRRAEEEVSDEEFFYNLTDFETARPAKIAAFFIILPCILCWNITGSFWINQIVLTTPQCLPEDSQPWFILMWMMFSYLFVTVQVMYLIVSAVTRARLNRLRRSFQFLETASLIDRWNIDGRLHYAYGLTSFRNGMNPDDVARLPLEKASKLDPELCSICLDAFLEDEDIRVLPGCYHRFHQGCADLWLVRRAFCPNCKRPVPTPPPVQMRSSSPHELPLSHVESLTNLAPVHSQWHWPRFRNPFNRRQPQQIVAEEDQPAFAMREAP